MKVLKEAILVLGFKIHQMIGIGPTELEELHQITQALLEQTEAQDTFIRKLLQILTEHLI